MCIIALIVQYHAYLIHGPNTPIDVFVTEAMHAMLHTIV